MLNIGYYPSWNQNKYNQQTIEILKSIEPGSTVDFVHPKKPPYFLRSAPNNKKYDFIVINWLENSLLNDRGQITIYGVLVYFFYLFYFKLSAKKTFYVRHNSYPHGCIESSQNLVEHITNFGEKLCTKRLTLSPHMESRGYAYIPHPLYDKGSLEPDESLNNYGEFYLMFGRILPYKNFEEVIEKWDNSVKLVIAGNPVSKDYLQSLEKLASDKNIVFIGEYITEARAAALASASQGLIVTHSDSSNVVVSASFFFATTFGAPVYTLKSDFFNYLVKEENYPGLFVFNNIAELVKNIKAHPYTDKTNIYQSADANFGKQHCIDSWRRLL